ncbi:MAG: DegT/DnrJ/EryC1/StrS family aminotransferase [Myxococcota bacterium]
MIPLARPPVGDLELAAMGDVLKTGMLVQGPQVARFEALLAERTGRTHAVVVSNGTAALSLALEAIGVGAGDSVLCPAFTWPSPAHAVRLLGGTVRLVDIDPATWNGDPAGYTNLQEIKAAIVIDQFGFPADHAAITSQLSVPVIVDGACAIGSTLAGKASVSHGLIATLSFHPRKVVTTGEGGACLTDDDGLAELLRELRNHGQGTSGFVRPGGNFRLTDFAAAMGIGQLERLDAILEERRAIAAFYREALPELTFQKPLDGALPNYQTIGAILPGVASVEDRDRRVAALRERGVQAGILSYSIGRLPSIDADKPCPVADRISDHGLALPCYVGLTENERETVVAQVRAVLG